MKKFKPFTFFLFIFIILFLLFAPAMIRTGLDKTNAAQKEQYKGILSLWHINGWQPGKAPASSLLRKSIRDFENKNAYVFIELTTLTPAKAAEKINAGEMPDMISFPTGFFSDPSLLMPLDDVDYQNTSLGGSSQYKGNTYAYAYLTNAYLLFYNQELLFEKEIDEVAFEKPRLKVLLTAAQSLSFTRKEGKKQKEVYGLAVQGEYITSPFAALAFFTEDGGTQSKSNAEANNITYQTEKGTEFFINKQAAFLIASASTADVLKNSKQTPPAWQASAFSAYSDMVQYMGVCKTDDPDKLNMCKKFAASLLNEKNSKRAEALGVFPVTSIEELFQDDAVLKNAYDTMLNKGVFPNTFEYANVQKELMQYAKGALIGDETSIQNIRRLFSKKLYS